MGDESARAAFIEASVDETLDGLADLLPPEALAAVRARLEDDLVAHPVLSQLAREHAPRKTPARSDDVPTGDDVIEKARDLAKAKQHG